MGSRLERTLGLALVALLLVLAVLAMPEDGVVSTDRRASTTRSSPPGVRALYVALEELGVPVARRMSPLVDAGPVPAALALVAPSEPPTPRELAALLARIRAGGALLYVARAPDDALLDTLGLELRAWWEVLAAREDTPLGDLVGAGVASAGESTASAPEGVWTVGVRAHPWTREVGSVTGFRWAFTAAGEPRPTRPPGRPLLADGDSLVFALTVPLGEGRVVALSDVAPLTNEHIREAGVAPVVIRAAAALAASGDTLVFDEYHHGFRGGSVRSGVARFLARHPAGHAALQLAAVLALALLVAGRRFGAPEPAPVPRRSPLEHVDALALAYRESGARRRPRLLLLSGLARHARRPRPRDAAEARTLLDRLRTTAPGAGPALDRLDASLEGDEAGLVALSAAVDRVTEELTR